MRKGRGEAGETVTGGRAATVRHVFGERVLSICMPNGKDHPKGWRWVALSDVAQMESGHTPSRNHPEYWGGEIPWISVKDARLAHGKRLSETEEYTNSLGIANSSARLLPKGTVCLSRGGTVGYVVILDKPMATSQGFANWICGPQLVPEFLQYLLLAEAESLEKFSIGTTIKTIYYPDLKAFHVCLPPLPEQKRIVALLDEAFTGIDEAKAKAEERKLLSGELSDACLESFLSDDSGWITTSVSECADINTGFAFKSSGFSKSSTDVRLLGGDNIINGAIRWENIRRWPKGDSQNYQNFFLSSGDIVLAMDRPIVNSGLKIAMVCADDLPALLIQRTARLRAKDGVSADFLYLALNSARFINHLNNSQKGVGVPHVSARQIGSFSIKLPPRHEQEIITTLLSKIISSSAHVALNSARALSNLSELKQSLLTKAFAGELTA